MKKVKHHLTVSIFVFVISFFSVVKSSAAVTLNYEALFKSSLTSKRLKLKDFSISLLKKNSTGQYVTAYALNDKKQRTPASISKVLTAVGLFELHGIHKKIPTQIFSTAKIKKGKLKGDLYIKGFGDPSFVSQQLWLLINELSKWGVKSIEGDLIFDDSFFKDEGLLAGRKEWNQRAYNAMISALPLNWNAVRVRFLDPEESRVVTDPYNPYFDLRVKKAPRKKSQVEIRESKKGETLSVFYGYDAFKEEKSIYRRVYNPRKVFESQFKEFLKKEGISNKGKVRWAKLPNSSSLILLGEVKSPAFSELIKLMMKFSNNFIADTLTEYSAVEEFSTESASYQKGLEKITRAFQSVSSFKDLVFQSASGLSRANKMRASNMGELLNKVSRKPYYPEFLSSFPLSCVDGTLKDRLCNLSQDSYVRAKTGLLAGVASLAGYAHQAPSLKSSKAGGAVGKDYIFAFVYNGRNGNQFAARNSFDAFLKKILN